MIGDSFMRKEYNARSMVIVMPTMQKITTHVARLLDTYSILDQERYHGAVRDNLLSLFQPQRQSIEKAQWWHRSVPG